MHKLYTFICLVSFSSASIGNEPPDYPPPRGPFVATQAVLTETAEPKPSKAKALPEIQGNLSKAEFLPTPVVETPGIKEKQPPLLKPKTSQSVKVKTTVATNKRKATRTHPQGNWQQYPGQQGYYTYPPGQRYQQQPAYRGGYVPYPNNHPYTPYTVPARR